jgi:hypothetical protein
MRMFQSVLRKYADFTGTAARPEFWWFALSSVVAHVALNALKVFTDHGTVYLGNKVGHAVIHSGHRKHVLLEEFAADSRAPILNVYLAAAPGARAHIPVDRHGSIGKLEEVAADYPVLEIRYLR